MSLGCAAASRCRVGATGFAHRFSPVLLRNEKFVLVDRFDRCSVGLADFEYVVDPGEQYVNPDPVIGAAPIDLSGWAESIERWRRQPGGAGL